MVKVTVGTTTERTDVVKDVDTTVESILREQGIPLGGHIVNLNMRVLGQGDINKTLDELGVQDETTATLICCVKADSAK